MVLFLSVGGVLRMTYINLFSRYKKKIIMINKKKGKYKKMLGFGITPSIQFKLNRPNLKTRQPHGC